MAIRPYGTWPSALDADLVARTSSPRLRPRRRRRRPRPLDGVARRRGRPHRRSSRRGPQRRRRCDPARDERANARPRVRRRRASGTTATPSSTPSSPTAASTAWTAPARSRGRSRPEPAEPHALRYADGVVTPDGETVICVRERHDGGEVRNELVSLPADGSAEPRVLVSGHDFFVAPRLDPAGSAARLARLGPPADAVGRHGALGRRARRARRRAARRRRRRRVGARPAMVARRRPPLLLGPHRLVEPLPRRRHGADLARRRGARLPGLGLRDALLRVPRRRADRVRRHARRGRVARAARSRERHARVRRARLDVRTRPSALAAGGGRVVFGAASPTQPARARLVRPGDRPQETLRRSLDIELDPASISIPRAIEFPTERRRDVAHAFYYPPASAEWEGPGRRASAAARDLPRRPDRAHASRSSTSRSSSSRSAGSASSTSTTAAAPATDASTGGS